MPHYFFDVRDRGGSYRDADGVELQDILEAREQADAIVQAMARDVRPNVDADQWICEVRDIDGAPLYRAKLSLCIERWDASVGQISPAP